MKNSRWTAWLWIALCAAAPLRAAQRASEFFESGSIPNFKFEIAESELHTLRTRGTSYADATVTVGATVFTNVGVRLKGRGSFRPIEGKPSLAVKFNQFAPGQKFHGLTKIMLNNSSQDLTYFSEFLAASLFRDAGVPAARVTHARVSLNGRDLGLYVLIEAMNKPFLKHCFTNATGNLYEGYARDIDQKLEQDGGTPGDQSDVRALVQAARLPPSERTAAIGSMLDVERLYAFLAVTTMIAQHDSYQYNRNNYRLYHDPKSDRFVMIPHGVDGTFAENNLSIRPPAKFVLTKAVLETEEGRRQYRDTLGRLFTNVFKLEVVTNRIETVAERLRAAATSEQERAGISSHQATFLHRVTQRHQSVAKQLTQPDPPRLVVGADEAVVLTGWEPSIDADASIVEKRLLDGRLTLYVKNLAVPSAGAWRTRAVLEPGRYRFSGQVQTSDGSSGVSLRTYKMYAPPKRVSAPGAWTPLEHRFAVAAGDEEVEFICDFRSSGSEGWFACDSLQLIREK